MVDCVEGGSGTITKTTNGEVQQRPKTSFHGYVSEIVCCFLILIAVDLL